MPVDGPDQGRLVRLGRRSGPRASPRRWAASRSRSRCAAASTRASSIRAWPTGCTTRRRRTPATTSCCASSAATARRAAARVWPRPPRPSTTRRWTASSWRTRCSPPTAYGPSNEPSSTAASGSTASSPGIGLPARSPGLSVVTADSETPSQGHQHDTSVVAQPPRPSARPAAQGRHDAVARATSSRSWRRSTPSTPSPTTTWSGQRAAGVPGHGARAAVPGRALGWGRGYRRRRRSAA